MNIKELLADINELDDIADLSVDDVGLSVENTGLMLARVRCDRSPLEAVRRATEPGSPAKRT